MLFTAPTAIRVIRKEDPAAKHLAEHDISSLKYLFVAGERLDPDTYHWATDNLGVPVVDHWWQTETGWAIAANPMGVEQFPIKAGSPTKPMPGYDVQILHDDGYRCEPGEEGSICIALPLPPGTLPTLWNADARYEASYLSEHPGYYLTGDGGRFDSDGYLFVMGRTDDVINVAGHRLSTGQSKRCWRCTRRWLSAPSSACPTRSRAGPERPGGAQGRRRTAGVDLGAGRVGARGDRCRRGIQDGRRGAGTPEDAVRQDSAQNAAGIAAGRDEPVPSTIEDASVLEALKTVLGQ